MKVGSLVKYVSFLQYTDMITPDKTEIYTVRDVVMSISEQRPKPHLGIRLEEIVNSISYNGTEFTYVAEHFIEVQPPMDDVLKELFSNPDLKII